MYVKLKVTKSDGSDLADKEKIGPVNMFLQALFSITEVTLQNKVTIMCNYNPYRAIVDAMMNYGGDAKKSQLMSQLYLPDDADSPEVCDPASTKMVYMKEVNT